MKKLISLIVCICMACTALCACSDSTGFSKSEELSDGVTRNTDPTACYNYSDGAHTPPTVYNSYSSEITDFELRLFRTLDKQNSEGGSYVFAPINTTLTLGLLANGASGKTQMNIVNELSDELSLESVNQCSSYLASRLASFNSAVGEKDENGDETQTYYIKLKNTLLFNDNVDVRKNFLQTNANYYGFDIFRFDFSGDNVNDRINSLFTEYTENSASPYPAEEDKLYSVSASDIYDTWINAYAQTDVSQGIFNSSSGEKTANYMTSNESFLHTDTAQGIVKYTAYTPLKFVAIMPNEGISLDEYIASFTYLEFSDMLESFDVTKKVSASIPEFSVEDNSLTGMRNYLQTFGVGNIFTDEITFSNISLSDNVYVHDMCEVTPKITVNAAGICGQESNGGISPLEKHFEETENAEDTLEFNRPFIFMLLDNESNIPVYIGTVDL